MDYKYIEQLLERYWNAETTTEEELILKSFFAQSDVPAELRAYKDLFEYEQAAATDSPGSDFDERVMKRIDEAPERVKAVRTSWFTTLRPLFQSAAAIAIVVLVALGAGKSFRSSNNQAWDYDPSGYQDTYNNPQQAYKVLEGGLELFQKTAEAVADSSQTQPLFDAKQSQ